jgi:hypothetical protein
LVNFHKFAKEEFGIEMSEEMDNRMKGLFWKRVAQLIKEGKQFFGMMEPMDDAFVLWDYVRKYDPIILSATGYTKTAKPEKCDWVKRYLGDHFVDTALFVISAEDKYTYATRHSILIDDRSKAIDPWREAGGIGILHISAKDTIKQLRGLGL